jgi:copper(I)-binding protein
MKRRSFFVALLWPAIARAHSYKAGDIAIGHAWALPCRQQVDGQAFFPLVNNGAKPDELAAARSSICAMIELRQNNRYDDLPLKSFELDPGKPLPMRPTARHLRLIGLRQPLVVGEQFAMVLDFLNAGEAEIEVHVAEGPNE